MKNISPLILIGFLLAGCQPLFPKHLDIFENPTCEPPCWMNITPGVTLKRDALVILSKIDVVDQPIVDLNRSTIKGFTDELRFSFHNDNNFTGWIYILGDQVSMIGFVIPTSYSGVKLEHAIELFGTPQNILLIQTGHFDQITLLNAKRGIDFGYKLFGSESLDSSKIDPNVKIREIYFFDPNRYRQVLNSGVMSTYILSGDEIKNNMHPWSGYGSFKDKYWPPATEPLQ